MQKIDRLVSNPDIPWSVDDLTVGCIFCDDDMADVLILPSKERLSEDYMVNDEFFSKYVFIRVCKPEDIWNRCKPMLDTMRILYGNDVKARMVTLHGMKYMGKTLYRIQKYAWLSESSDYRELIDELNGVNDD